jgi:hypothetical protein
MQIKSISQCCVGPAMALLGALVWPAATDATPSTVKIVQMSTQNFGDYYQTAGTGNGGIPVLSEPGTYYLDNGNNWYTGAGSFGGSAYATAVNVSVTGTTIRYTLGDLTTPDLMSYTDYDGGSHSSEGTIDPYGALIIVATQGATTATLSSTALITANPISNYNDSRYNYYAAPVGSLVPFTVTYDLSGSTWQPNTFSTSFTARPEGLINFAAYTPVPEPSMLLPAAAAALLMLAHRRTPKRSRSSRRTGVCPG